MGYSKKNNNNSGKKKQSGCKLHNHLDSEKGLFMSVWKVEKGVMWSGKITMTPSQIKTGIRVSKSGKKWVSVLLRMNAPMHNQVAVTGMMNVDTQKVYFKDWNTMANPRANNGGYYGKHISKNYN